MPNRHLEIMWSATLISRLGSQTDFVRRYEGPHSRSVQFYPCESIDAVRIYAVRRINVHSEPSDNVVCQLDSNIRTETGGTVPVIDANDIAATPCIVLNIKRNELTG